MAPDRVDVWLWREAQGQGRSRGRRKRARGQKVEWVCRVNSVQFVVRALPVEGGDTAMHPHLLQPHWCVLLVPDNQNICFCAEDPLAWLTPSLMRLCARAEAGDAEMNVGAARSALIRGQ
jgi:hypothetical protein